MQNERGNIVSKPYACIKRLGEERCRKRKTKENPFLMLSLCYSLRFSPAHVPVPAPTQSLSNLFRR